MRSKASTPEEYIDTLPDERKPAVASLRATLRKNLPKGFSEVMSSGMIGYVVPHQTYPAGYHCDPGQPLPFICIASQKSHMALYHMGIYADAKLLKWFTAEYGKQAKSKLDMGKSCIRFKKPAEIPFKLIGELAKKVSVKEWIALYESKLKPRR